MTMATGVKKEGEIFSTFSGGDILLCMYNRSYRTTVYKTLKILIMRFGTGFTEI